MWPFIEMVKVKFSGRHQEFTFRHSVNPMLSQKIKTLKESSLILKPEARTTNTKVWGRKPSWEHSVPQGPMGEGNVSTLCYLPFDPCVPEIKCCETA